jgi:hypothetical protein
MRSKSSSCLGDGLGHALTTMVGLSGEAIVEFHSPCRDSFKAIVHSTFDGDINHVVSLL